MAVFQYKYPLKLILLILVISFCGQINFGQGFKQELQLFTNNTEFYFDAQVEDTSIYGQVFQQVNGYCARGRWLTYLEANFTGFNEGLGVLTDLGEAEWYCDRILEGTIGGSFRHLGASETGLNSVSLYTGPDYGGYEYLLDVTSYTGINRQVYNIAATGNVTWTLFEGPVFSGKSVCFTVPLPGSNSIYRVDSVPSLNLTQIGSLYQGCSESN